MGMIYFPSCKFTAQFPNASRKIQNYLREIYDSKIAGCCEPGLGSLAEGDTAVTICHTCAAFFHESSAAGKVLSLWELLCDDRRFPFPSHAGRQMTVQDCWRTRGDADEQEAVRRLLRRMDIGIVEQEGNHRKTKFCGLSLYEARSARYERLAPERLVKQAGGFFIPHTEEEKVLLMKQHCDKIETEEVVCYCLSCTNGITSGGKKGVHLLELLFS